MRFYVLNNKGKMLKRCKFKEEESLTFNIIEDYVNEQPKAPLKVATPHSRRAGEYFERNPSNGITL